MIILLIIGVVLVAGAIVIIAHALAPQSDEQAKTLSQISTYGFRRRGEGEESTKRVRDRFDNLAGGLGAAVGGRGGDGTDLNKVRAELVAAGLYNTSPGRFTGYRVLCTIGLPLLWI